MRIEVVKNFLSHEEIEKLNEWTKQGLENNWLDYGVTTGGVRTSLRKTTRLYANRFEFSQFAKDIRDKVKKFVGIEQYGVLPNYRDGILNTCIFPNGDVFRHKDPNIVDGLNTGLAVLHCNIVTKAAKKGCEIYVEGHRIDVGEGDLHCYLVSEHEHWVTKNEGDTPRIIWMFGALLPADDWNSGKIQLGVN